MLITTNLHPWQNLWSLKFILKVHLKLNLTPISTVCLSENNIRIARSLLSSLREDLQGLLMQGIEGQRSVSAVVHTYQVWLMDQVATPLCTWRETARWHGYISGKEREKCQKEEVYSHISVEKQFCSLFYPFYFLDSIYYCWSKWHHSCFT